MADRSNRLWAGLAAGLLAATGVVATGRLMQEGGAGPNPGDGGPSALVAGPDAGGDDSRLTGLADGDPSTGGSPSGDAGRAPTLLVVAPEHRTTGGSAAQGSTTTTATPASSTAAPTTPATMAPTSALAVDPTSSSDQPTGETTPGSTAMTAAPSTEAPAGTAGPTTAAPTTPAPTTAPSGSGDARSLERQVLDLTNAERRKAGCPDLAGNAKLHAAALAHSTDMATQGYFSHTGADGSSMSDRVEREGYAWRALAENIAAGYRTPQAVVTGWMNSSGHRANILNCGLTEIGVGFHDYHWTQDFGTPR
jgi:uncharacterized protein YkwD